MADLEGGSLEHPRLNGGSGFPRWLHPTIDAVEQLLQLKANWNSYGGLPIAWAAASDALILLLDTMDAETPSPSVVPTARGGVQLEWHLAGLDLEVETLGGSRFSFFIADRQTGEEREVALDRAHVEPLRTALAELTRRAASPPIPA